MVTEVLVSQYGNESLLEKVVIQPRICHAHRSLYYDRRGWTTTFSSNLQPRGFYKTNNMAAAQLERILANLLVPDNTVIQQVK